MVSAVGHYHLDDIERGASRCCWILSAPLKRRCRTGRRARRLFSSNLRGAPTNAAKVPFPTTHHFTILSPQYREAIRGC
jgi:hypothetical protein